MELTLDNIAISSANLSFPLNGVWAGDVTLSSDEQFSASTGHVLRIDDVTLACSIVSKADNEGSQLLRIVGGNGGLSYAPRLPRNMKDPNGRDIALALIKDASEEAGTIHSEFGKREFKNFQLLGSLPIGWQLGHFASQQGFIFQVNAKGRIDVKRPSKAPVRLPEDATLTETLHDGSLFYSFGSLERLPMPGETIDGQEIKTVFLSVSNSSLSLGFGFHDEYLKIKQSTIDNALNGSYSGIVVSQNHDGPDNTLGGTLNIQPDLPMIRGGGMAAVPMRLLPGMAVRVPVGTRVTIRFDERNASKPYVDSFHLPGDFTQLPSSSSEYLFTIGDPSKADFVALAELVKQNLEDIKSYVDGLKSDYNSHTHATNGAEIETPYTGTYTISEVAASQLKTT